MTKQDQKMTIEQRMKLEELPEIDMHGPVEVSMTVHVLTAEGKAARLTMTTQAGVIPEQKDLAKMMAACMFDGDIPAGTRFMTKPEFVAHITKRETGIAMPMPGNQEFVSIQLDTKKRMLIDAICGNEFKSYEESDRWEKAGFAKYTGNQWNEKWEWKREKLEFLVEAELLDIYNEITGG